MEIPTEFEDGTESSKLKLNEIPNALEAARELRAGPGPVCAGATGARGGTRPGHVREGVTDPPAAGCDPMSPLSARTVTASAFVALAAVVIGRLPGTGLGRDLSDGRAPDVFSDRFPAPSRDCAPFGVFPGRMTFGPDRTEAGVATRWAGLPPGAPVPGMPGLGARSACPAAEGLGSSAGRFRFPELPGMREGFTELAENGRVPPWGVFVPLGLADCRPDTDGRLLLASDEAVKGTACAGWRKVPSGVRSSGARLRGSPRGPGSAGSARAGPARPLHPQADFGISSSKGMTLPPPAGQSRVGRPSEARMSKASA